MVTDPKDDPATLAMLKTMSPMVDDQRYAYEGRDALDIEGSRDGDGGVRLLADDHDLVRCHMNHTPGVWVAKARATGGYNIVAVDDVLEDVVVGTVTGNEHSLETAHANAHMMAASEKMYGVLKFITTEGHPPALIAVFGEELWEQMVKAVLSAEGESWS